MVHASDSQSAGSNNAEEYERESELRASTQTEIRQAKSIDHYTGCLLAGDAVGDDANLSFGNAQEASLVDLLTRPTVHIYIYIYMYVCAS